MEPEDQPRVEPTVEAIGFGYLQGAATLSGGERVACGAFAVRQEDGPDWLLLYMPMGALKRLEVSGTAYASELKGIGDVIPRFPPQNAGF